MAQTAPKDCQALLDDLWTPCPRTFRTEGLFCSQHGQEYASVTKTYKKLSDNTAGLKRAPLSGEAIRALNGRGLSSAISTTQDYLLALNKEIATRTVHHLRFFGEADDGHGQWLAILQSKRKKASGQLAALKDRKNELRNLNSLSRSRPESAIIDRSHPDWDWDTTPEDGPISYVDLMIVIPCLVVLALALWMTPATARAMFWSYLRSLLSSVRPIAEPIISITGSVVRLLWALFVLYCIFLWNIACLASDVLWHIVASPRAGN